MRQISLILFLFFQLVGFSQDSLRFIFAGDVMQHGGQIAAAYNAKNDTYDYKDCFKFVKPIIQRADISIANLEVTHAGKPYKGYPQFSAPPQLSEAIVDAGFNVILTANNHSCDGGKKGIIGTLDVLDRLQVKHTGTFRNQAERDANYPLMIQKNGFQVAILNYTYGTNGLTVAPPLIVNYIDSAVILKDIQKAKKNGADYIVCMMHWGDEYKSLPSKFQKNWEKYCYELGADMVIGSHPHVLQPVEKKTIQGKEKLTVWSLGNFVSNQRDRYKDGGMLVQTTIQKGNEKSIRILSVETVLTYVHPRQEGQTKPFYILPDFDYNAIQPGFLTTENKIQQTQFYSDSRALFDQYNRSVNEFLVSNDSILTAEYTFLLTGYFAVKLEEKPTSNFEIQIPKHLHKMVRQFTTGEGNYVLLCGFYKTAEEAKFASTILKELYFPKVVPVYVDPKQFTCSPIELKN